MCDCNGAHPGLRSASCICVSVKQSSSGTTELVRRCALTEWAGHATYLHLYFSSVPVALHLVNTYQMKTKLYWYEWRALGEVSNEPTSRYQCMMQELDLFDFTLTLVMMCCFALTSWYAIAQYGYWQRNMPDLSSRYSVDICSSYFVSFVVVPSVLVVVLLSKLANMASMRCSTQS